MAYYNTVSESGQQLDLFKSKANTQDERILELFKVSGKLSASLIFPLMNCPITSIRRSLNTLENNMKIMKLEVKVRGMYGRLEYLYKII